jgi:hypothetical protein
MNGKRASRDVRYTGKALGLIDSHTILLANYLFHAPNATSSVLQPAEY